MKIQLEHEDIEAIAQRVAELLKPLLAGVRNDDQDIIFNVPGLAEYLRTSESWVYERTRLKEIPHHKVKGLLMFRKPLIDKWIEAHRVPVITASTLLLNSRRAGVTSR